VHNPDLPIATINKKGRLEIELVVERGRGYVTAVQNKQPGQEIGVSRSTRSTRRCSRSPTPSRRPCRAAHRLRPSRRRCRDQVVDDPARRGGQRRGTTLVELFGLFRELNDEAEGIDVGPSRLEVADIAAFSMPIEELDLTVRSYNCLKRGHHHVGELVGRSEADLLDIRNFGSKSIDEVKIKLSGLGLALKDSPPGFEVSHVESYGMTTSTAATPTSPRPSNSKFLTFYGVRHAHAHEGSPPRRAAPRTSG